MKRRSFVPILLVSTFIPALGAGLGAQDFRHIDAVRVDEKTGATTLLLVIDRPLEDGLTNPKVRSKIRGYHDWVYVRGELSKHNPKADLTSVSLLILHPQPRTSLGISVLEQIIAYAKEMRFRPVARLAPTKP